MIIIREGIDSRICSALGRAVGDYHRYPTVLDYLELRPKAIDPHRTRVVGSVTWVHWLMWAASRVEIL